jgi:hypothetical protein
MNGKDPHAISISVLQSQLSETQSNLSGYAGKIRELEGKVEEHKGVKVEVGLLRERMEETERDLERLGKGGSAQGRGGRESPVAALLEREEEEEDDDDAASVASMDTVMDNNVVGRKGRARSASMREMDKAEEEERRTADLERERHLVEQNQRLAERLEALSVELDEATKLGQTLKAQHADAATTIKTLEACVVGLEKAVEGRVKEVEGRVSAEAERWMGWRVEFEMGWKKERESWEVEREKLMRVVRDWEERRSEESEASDESEAETVEMSRELSGSTVESKSPRGKKGKGKKKKKGNKGVKVVEGNTKVDIPARVNGTTSAAEAVVVDGGSSAIKSKSSTAAVDDDSGSRNTSLSVGPPLSSLGTRLTQCSIDTDVTLCISRSDRPPLRRRSVGLVPQAQRMSSTRLFFVPLRRCLRSVCNCTHIRKESLSGTCKRRTKNTSSSATCPQKLDLPLPRSINFDRPPAGNMSRAPLIASAVTFLRDPSTSSSPLAQRIAFLESKGLSPPEIEQALSAASSNGGGNYSGGNGYGGGGYGGMRGKEFERDWRDWFIMGVVGGAVGWVGVRLVQVSYVLVEARQGTSRRRCGEGGGGGNGL